MHEHLTEPGLDPAPKATRTRDVSASSRTSRFDQETVLRLQRAAGNASVSSLIEQNLEERSPVMDVVGSGGAPLGEPVRSMMESRLGHDFGDVRVHDDAKATESARAVQAHAYTVGNDIVFQSGSYQPESSSGRRMLAHELTHVVQQRSGPVDGTPAAGGVRISDPSDRFEQAAEASAEAVMSAAPVSQAGVGSAAEAVQREAAEEEEEQVQAYALQRQGEEEEEPLA